MRLIVVTPTHERPGRIGMLASLRGHLDRTEDVSWVVVEDGPPDIAVRALLPSYAAYLHLEGRSDFGNPQRNLALQYVRDSGTEGIVYNADDDNLYRTELFEEIRRTKRLSVLPVGNLGPRGVERPVIVDGRLRYWDSMWKHRKFPVDMAGFAFHSDLLKELGNPLWGHRGRGGESEFISRLVHSPEELEFLCDGCRKVLVWHNGLRAKDQKIKPRT